MLFNKHLENCSPGKPCALCELRNFAREKFTREDFLVFSRIASRIPSPEGTVQEDPLLSAGIHTLELSVRTTNLLKGAQIETLGDILKYTPGELLAIPDFDQKGLDEIQQTCTERGCKLPS